MNHRNSNSKWNRRDSFSTHIFYVSTQCEVTGNFLSRRCLNIANCWERQNFLENHLPDLMKHVSPEVKRGTFWHNAALVHFVSRTIFIPVVWWWWACHVWHPRIINTGVTLSCHWKILTASRFGSPGSVPEKSMWDLKLRKWHWGRFFSEYLYQSWPASAPLHSGLAQEPQCHGTVSPSRNNKRITWSVQKP